MTSSTLNQLQVLLKHQLSLFVAFHASLLSLSLSFLIYICPSVPHSLPRFFLHLSRFQHYLALPLPCPLAGAALGRAAGPGAAGLGRMGSGEGGLAAIEQPAGRCPAPTTSRRDPPPLPPSTHPPLAIHSSPSGYSWLSAPHRRAPAADSSYTDLVLASLRGTSAPLLP